MNLENIKSFGQLAEELGDNTDKFTVYTHTDINGDVFYVGQGGIGRPWSTCDRSIEWREVSKAESMDEVITLLAVLDTREEAIELENHFIDKYGRKNLHRGELINKVGGTLGLPEEFKPKKYKRGERKLKPITQIDLKGNVVAEWSSAKAITKELGYGNSTIRRVCNQGTVHDGFRWEFKTK